MKPGATRGGWALALAAVTLLALPAATDARVAKPVIEQARGDKCIAEPGRMRREHMDMLKHQRDETTRLGVRGAQASLRECIECHASSVSGSVAARRDDFCSSCHSYTGVKLDCFECHSSRPSGTARPAAQTVPAPSRTGP